MIAKRQIAAKTPYAPYVPYVMSLILSCVVLDDKRLRAGDEMALKSVFVADYQYLLDFTVCSTGLICRSAVPRDAESNI